VGMLAEEQEIGHGSNFARRNQALLESRGVAVSNPSQIDRAAGLHRSGPQALCFIARDLLSNQVKRNALVEPISVALIANRHTSVVNAKSQ
jgi:hypothetical protein